MGIMTQVFFVGCAAGSWAVAAPGPKDPPKADPPSIVGEWVMETAGDPFRLTVTADGKYLKTRGKVTFATQTYAINPKKEPAEIDLTQTGLGVTTLGIYRVDGDRLTLCFSRSGGDRPSKFEKAGPSVTLMTFKRVKAAD